MTNEPTFWRLIGDYEVLCTDEAVALREVNLAALARLQAQKSVVGQAITSLAVDLGSKASSARVENLIAQQKRNLLLAQEQLARMECQRLNLATASQRLDSFGKAYSCKTIGPSTLEAEG